MVQTRKRKVRMNENVSKSSLSIYRQQQQQQQQHNQKRFMGVRQSQSGRWVAEIKGTAQKIRLWLGTFDTPDEAAHAYDEAACLLRGADTRTNFWPRTTGGFDRPTGSNPGSSSVLSSKVLNQLLDHLKTQRATKSTPQSLLSLPQHHHHQQQQQQQSQQQHNHKQELELITRMANDELFCDVSTSCATTHRVDGKYCRGYDEMKNKVEVERDVSLDMDLKLEDFSYFFAPFDPTEGRKRVEIGTYEYWSMLFAAAKGV